MATSPRRPLSNRGGGCVQHYEVSATPPGHHVLRLRWPSGCDHPAALADSRYVDIGLGSSPAARTLRGVGLAPLPRTLSLIDLLSRVLTLPSGSDVDFALALDWTKTPVEGVDPTQWPSTQIYDLVRRGKYGLRDPRDEPERRQVGLELVRRLCTVIDEHPLLRAVDAIVAVPGHDAKQVSFGGRVATTVALHRGARLVRCSSVAPFRTPAKDLDPKVRASIIDGQFRCLEGLDEQTVLIVDDLYGSGTTVGEAARAARAAGAVRVASLCGVRTMRFL